MQFLEVTFSMISQVLKEEINPKIYKAIESNAAELLATEPNKRVK